LKGKKIKEIRKNSLAGNKKKDEGEGTDRK
jgi:hypothetical protein